MFSSKRIGRHRFSSAAAAADLSNRDAFLYDYERTFVAPAPYWLQHRRGRRASAGGGPCLGIWSFWCVHTTQYTLHTIAAAAAAALLQSPTPPTSPAPIARMRSSGTVCIREVKGKIVLLILLLSSLFDYIYNNNTTILVHRCCTDRHCRRATINIIITVNAV